MAPSGRLDYIESIRGIACLLLIAFHVTGASSLDGLHLSDTHPLRLINDSLDDTRMPIFAFVSGFVLHAAIMGSTQLQKSVWSKSRRLLIPMAAVGALHYMLRSHTGAEQQPFYTIFFVQYAHFWFLQASFLLNVALLALSYTLGGKSHRAALVLLVTVTPVFIFATRWDPNIFSVYQGLYLAPFFFFGHLFAGYLRDRQFAGKGLLPAWVTVVVAAVFLVTFSCNFILTANLVTIEGPLGNIYRLVVGFPSVLILFLLRPSAKMLVWVGGYTYTIYLFHVMFAATFREILMRSLPQIDPAWLFAPCFVVGLFGPVLLQQVFLKNDVTAMLFLGIDLKGRRAASPPNPIAAPHSG